MSEHDPRVGKCGKCKVAEVPRFPHPLAALLVCARCYLKGLDEKR